MRALKTLALAGLLAASAIGLGGNAEAATPAAMLRDSAARADVTGDVQNVNYYRGGYYRGGPYYRGGYYGRPYWGGYYGRPWPYRPYYAPAYRPFYPPPYYYAPPVYYYPY